MVLKNGELISGEWSSKKKLFTDKVYGRGPQAWQLFLGYNTNTKERKYR